MKMRKINDRLYEFFVGDEDNKREITDLVVSEQEEDDSSWIYRTLNESKDYFDLDSWMSDDVDDYIDDEVIDVDYEEVELIDHEDVEVISKPKTKRDELLESLSYLKSKSFKTKQDRESIYTLEMVLKNMK